MSNKLKISLSIEYTSIPAHCEVYCCGELIFNGPVDKDIILTHEFVSPKKFDIKIIKSGKTLDIVHKKHRQIVYVKNINLNGIDLKIHEFGEFKVKNNPYVDDHTLQTATLSLNGEWSFALLEQPLVGIVDLDNIRIRDIIEECDVACFGCSNTYGLDSKEESWPYQLGKILNCSVNNYGIPGSNINEMTALVEEYIKNNNTKIILMLIPHSMRRQHKDGNKIINVFHTHDSCRKFVLHGEEHSAANLSMSMTDWLKNIKTKIYIGTYHDSEYKLLSRTPLNEYMLPFLDYEKYPKASDGLHFGAEYCKDYATLVADFIKNKEEK